MFEISRRRTGSRTAFQMLTLTFHWAAREMTTSNRNPVHSLVNEVIQSVLMIAVFFGMFQIMGMQSTAVRGDFLLYLMSGIFCFIVHTKAVGEMSGAEGPLSPMMLHAPMNTTVAIGARAISSIYKQMIGVTLILFLYDAVTDNVEFYRIIPAAGMFMLAWASGCCIGLVLLAIKPYAPKLVGLFSMIYRRANMLFSGKMFLANTLPASMLPLFDWNPLFHIIDQCRGFTFLNYNPHFSSVAYPIKISLIFLVIGLMAEFTSRKNASLSASKG